MLEQDPSSGIWEKRSTALAQEVAPAEQDHKSQYQRCFHQHRGRLAEEDRIDLRELQTGRLSKRDLMSMADEVLKSE